MGDNNGKENSITTMQQIAQLAEEAKIDYESKPQSTQKEKRMCFDCVTSYQNRSYDPYACGAHKHRTQTTLIAFAELCGARFPANENACNHFKIDPLHRLAILAGELAHRQLDHSREMMVNTAVDFTCVCAYFWRMENDVDGMPPMNVSTFWNLVVYEICRARFLFPSNRGVTSAFMEELGEAIEAIAVDKNTDDVQTELVQAAAMAARLALEGDPTMDKVRFDRELDL